MSNEDLIKKVIDTLKTIRVKRNISIMEICNYWDHAPNFLYDFEKHNHIKGIKFHDILEYCNILGVKINDILNMIENDGNIQDLKYINDKIQEKIILSKYDINHVLRYENIEIKNIQYNLKNYRLSKGMHQNHCAEKIGVSNTYLSNIEVGHISLKYSSIFFIIYICNTFDISIDFIARLNHVNITDTQRDLYFHIRCILSDDKIMRLISLYTNQYDENNYITDGSIISSNISIIRKNTNISILNTIRLLNEINHVNYNVSYLCNIENTYNIKGKTFTALSTIFKLCNFYNISIEYVLYGENYDKKRNLDAKLMMLITQFEDIDSLKSIAENLV